ncbi:MAG: GspH/FimT family pseudopilin [Thermoanaerobaculia bacterium]
MIRHGQRGFTLIEMSATVSIIGLLVLVAVPSFSSLRRNAAARVAAKDLGAIFHLTRSRAIARGTNSGLKFVKLGGEWQFAVYDDGDRDGIRNDDITKRVDRLVVPHRPVFQQTDIATIGLPSYSIVDPDGDKLPPTRSPVVFGNSTICSFSPTGESSPGTIYVTNRRDELYAVRVYGNTAKIRVLRYDRASRKWSPR